MVILELPSCYFSQSDMLQNTGMWLQSLLKRSSLLSRSSTQVTQKQDLGRACDACRSPLLQHYLVSTQFCMRNRPPVWQNHLKTFIMTRKI